MKRNTTRFLVVLLMLCFLCTACTGGTGSVESTESTESAESTESTEKVKNSTMTVKDDADEDLDDDSSADNEGTGTDFSVYEGLWMSDADSQYDTMYLEFDAPGNCERYSGGEAIDEGDLSVSEDDVTCVNSYRGGVIDGASLEAEGDRLYISTLGYFDYLDGRGGQWQGDGGGNWDGESREDSELYDQDVSIFEGVWYYDNDLSADTYIAIDGDGNWRFYQRVPGDAEATQMDYGTISCSFDDAAVYYADSSQYDGLQFRMYDLNEGVLLWNEDTYYRIE